LFNHKSSEFSSSYDDSTEWGPWQRFKCRSCRHERANGRQSSNAAVSFLRVRATLGRIPFKTFLMLSCYIHRLKATDWGDLDVLVLDLPPGTGDVQLAVCQELQLSGAVAVTTPSKLATEDTRKGIEMFTSLGVPTIAVVENMSYFIVSAKCTRLSFLVYTRTPFPHIRLTTPMQPIV